MDITARIKTLHDITERQRLLVFQLKKARGEKRAVILAELKALRMRRQQYDEAVARAAYIER